MVNENPVLRGILAAMQLKQAMDHASLQREELARRKGRDKREDELANFRTQVGLLESGARPVANGQYGGTVSMPASDPMNPSGVKMAPTQMPIPTDPGRTITAPGGGDYYIPSLNERFTEEFGRKIEALKAETDVKTQAQLGLLRTQHDLTKDIHAMDADTQVMIRGLEADAREKLQRNQQTWYSGEHAKDRTSREKVEEIQQKGANSRAAISENRADARQNKALTAGQREAQVTRNREDLTKLQREEDELHARRIQLGDAMKAGKAVSVDKETGERTDVDLTPGDKAKYEAEIRSYEPRIQAIQQEKEQIVRRLRLLGGDNSADPLNLLNQK
jgi:hypothetical protein